MPLWRVHTRVNPRQFSPLTYKNRVEEGNQHELRDTLIHFIYTFILLDVSKYPVSYPVLMGAAFVV